MQLFNVDSCRGEEAGYMAIGFFDTLHLGHKAVIDRAISLARDNNTISSVFLFKNNIYELIGVDKVPVFTFDQRIRQIEMLGVDKVFALNANKELLSLSPDEFTTFLRSKLHIKGIVCGADFSYGRNGEGSASDILHDFPAGEVVDLCFLSGEKVSTTLLKNKLMTGDLRSVNEMLGRPFSIVEKIVSGREDGKRIGFPTINMSFSRDILKQGVYISETIIDGEAYRSLTNIGTHPTFHDAHKNAETFILDFNGTLYGETVEVKLLDYLRDIREFENVEALKDQIKKDVEIRRKYDPIRAIGD